MIKITKDKETKMVTIGAYKNYYEPLGFTIVSENKMASKPEKVAKVQEPSNDEKKELVGKPDEENMPKTNEVKKAFDDNKNLEMDVVEKKQNFKRK